MPLFMMQPLLNHVFAFSSAIEQVTSTLSNSLSSVLISHLAVHCKSFRVEKFHGFHKLIGNCESFPVKQLIWPHETTMQPCNHKCFQ